MRVVLISALVALGGCKENRARPVPPTIAVDDVALEWGAVRVDTEVDKRVPISAATSATVTLLSVTLEGDDAFTLATPPPAIAGLGTEEVVLQYRPRGAAAHSATLIIRSDDELRPEVRVGLSGHGAFPALTLELTCDTATRCEAMVTQMPPAVHFADEPFVRLRTLEGAELPKLVLQNTSEVALVVSRLALEGPDANAFSFVGNGAIPEGGLVLGVGQQAQVPVRFRPTSDSQPQWAGVAVVESDDPARRRLDVALSGLLRPNLPPEICLNLARVAPLGRPPRDFDTATAWAEVLSLSTDGGVVDVSGVRDVPPRADVVLSALSSPEETTCTADPEDARLGLTWAWALTSQPSGSTSAVLVNANTPRASLRPVATGSYTAELSVTDSQGNRAVRALTFEVAVKNDLVAQVDWTGFAGVDLDVHLVRPGAVPFASWGQADGGGVNGDLNGYATTSRVDGGSFDWGTFGNSADDPQLNFDDTGAGALVENVSLNLPENDDACTSAACTYGLFVHGFRDARDAGAVVPCFVDGGLACRDAEPCGCAGGAVCVAAVAPSGAPASGAGRCITPVSGTVRVYLRGNAVPAVNVPVLVGAPCELVHAADVSWPARGTDAGVVVTAASDVRRFGVRSGGALQCAPDGPQGGVPWYREHPR